MYCISNVETFLCFFTILIRIIYFPLQVVLTTLGKNREEFSFCGHTLYFTAGLSSLLRDFWQWAAVAECSSSWDAEQEDRGSILGRTTWIFRDWLYPASKSRYGWNTTEIDVNPQYNQPTKIFLIVLWNGQSYALTIRMKIPFII